jgi:DNA-directed RNA polymerase specialized sigma24 family protein
MLDPRPQRSTTDVVDGEIARQLEHIIRRVKQSMNYRGSYSTRDILGSLVARWVQSGEWERLRQLPRDQRHLGESVRRFLLDRLDQLRRRGKREDLIELSVTLPDDHVLAEMVELAELRAWIAQRVGELVAGAVDARVRVPLADPAQTGRILELHLEGKTQREIAAASGVSLGLVNKRIAEGTSYLAVLQGFECGLM